MGEVIGQVQHEFWRPPVKAGSSANTSHELAQACEQCGTEFIVSSHYCHSCGAVRLDRNATSAWLELPGLAELAALAARVGLTTGALVAFLLGTLCVIVALTLGVMFSVKTPIDWQAIQLWRIQWLLGAIAAFIAGVVLKKSKTT
jgi:ribosomal protein L37E